MKKILMVGLFSAFLIGAALFVMPVSGDCED